MIENIGGRHIDQRPELSRTTRIICGVSAVAISGAVAGSTIDFFHDGVGTLDNPVSKVTTGVILATSTLRLVGKGVRFAFDAVQDRASNSLEGRSQRYHSAKKSKMVGLTLTELEDRARLLARDRVEEIRQQARRQADIE
jgi:hypothetical protein